MRQEKPEVGPAERPPVPPPTPSEVEAFRTPPQRAPIGAPEKVPAPIAYAWAEAWRVIKHDALALLLGGIVAGFLSGITIGILYGALTWGMLAGCWKRLRNEGGFQFGDIFSQFGRFGTSLGITFWSALAITVGLLLLVVPGLYLAVAFLYALPIGLDRRLGVIDSLKTSRAVVHRTGFWNHALLLLTLFVPWAILGQIGNGVLSLVFFPVAVAVLAAAYERIRPDVSVPSSLGDVSGKTP